MLCSCSRCGRIHKRGECPNKRIKLPSKGVRVDRVTDATRFRGSAEWKHKRIQILRRDLFVCRLCLSKGIINNTKLEVHHIKPILEGGNPTDDNNLITLCRTCHDKVENNQTFTKLLLKLVSTPPTLKP